MKYAALDYSVMTQNADTNRYDRSQADIESSMITLGLSEIISK